MVVNTNAKGARAETQMRDRLRELSGLGWERVPSSGALDPKHLLKGDLYVPGEKNLFAVECKHYAEDHLTSSILTAKDPTLLGWWEQTMRQGRQVGKNPLLVFKHDRSKIFCAFNDPPTGDYRFISICAKDYYFNISLLDDWYTHEQPKFIA